MKKSLTAAVLLCLVFAFILAGCNNGGANVCECGTNKCECNPTQELTYDKKYIHREEISLPGNEQEYFIFHENKTGEYHTGFYYNGYSGVLNYVVNFKYLTIEDTVVCFYDSVEYAADHTLSKDVSTTWRRIFGLSKDILIGVDAYTTIYVCEDYLSEIPNYGK